MTLGVGLAAVNTGNNLLYLVLGLMLSLLLVSGILSDLALYRIAVSRRLPRRAFAGTPFLVTTTLRNHKRRVPSFSIEVEARRGHAALGHCYFLKVPARHEQVEGIPIRQARRGLWRLDDLRIVTRYPFGLVEKARVVPMPEELLVYPALVPVEGLSRRRGAMGGERATAQRGIGPEVLGLRDYVTGDEARAIHWRRTATLGRLVVREQARDAAQRVALLVDEGRPDTADDAWDTQFERVVSRAASLAARALDEGMTVEVVSRTGRTGEVAAGAPPDRIWRYLALLEPVSLGAAKGLPALPGRRVMAVDALAPPPEPSPDAAETQPDAPFAHGAGEWLPRPDPPPERA